MNSGKRFFAIILLFVGLYIMLQWGFIGNAVITDVQAKTGTTPSNTGSPTKNAPLQPTIFGIHAPFSGFGEDVSSIVRNADIAGLVSHGSKSGFAHDFDYAANPGSPITLPGNGNVSYTYLGNSPGPWGNLLYFATPNGGVWGMPHVENILPLSIGQHVSGGTIVADVGKGPYSSTYWTGPHMSIIADNLAMAWFSKVQSGL